MPVTNVESIFDDLRLSSQVIQGFAHLTKERFNWKPSSEQWSVAQCVDHLRLANEAYGKVITGALDENRKTSTWERIPLLPKFFGNLLVNALEPGRGRRINTTQDFVPAMSDFELSLLNDFELSQQAIMQAMKSVEHLDMRKLIVTSVFAKVVTYSLYDCCRIVAVHERRHILQAKNVMTFEGFPV